MLLMRGNSKEPCTNQTLNTESKLTKTKRLPNYTEEEHKKHFPTDTESKVMAHVLFGSRDPIKEYSPYISYTTNILTAFHFAIGYIQDQDVNATVSFYNVPEHDVFSPFAVFENATIDQFILASKITHFPDHDTTAGILAELNKQIETTMMAINTAFTNFNAKVYNATNGGVIFDKFTSNLDDAIKCLTNFQSLISEYNRGWRLAKNADEILIQDKTINTSQLITCIDYKSPHNIGKIKEAFSYDGNNHFYALPDEFIKSFNMKNNELQHYDLMGQLQALNKIDYKEYKFDENQFTIMTFNIFSGNCMYLYGDNSNLTYICEQKKLLSPDIIFIQEYPREDYMKNITFFKNDYNTKQCIGDSKHENVGIILKRPYNKYTEIKQIFTEPDTTISSMVSNRYGFIYTHETIKIANIHLEGGKYFDENVLTADDNQFVLLLNYKCELLTNILNESPDIIVGDFNSIYDANYADKDKYYATAAFIRQYEYFKSKQQELLQVSRQNIITSDDILKVRIHQMNTLPYCTLRDNLYQYILPENADAYTSGFGLSIVDTIWATPSFIDRYNYKCTIVNLDERLLTAETDKGSTISDHNPVLVTFTKKSCEISKKYYKYKNKYLQYVHNKKK